MIIFCVLLSSSWNRQGTHHTHVDLITRECRYHEIRYVEHVVVKSDVSS